MINITKVRYKNFFSVGNAFLEFDLTKDPKTVIAGKNGDGKSTLMSAITFGLFDRTIKAVNKPNIVNSINKKDCLVEIELSISNDKYLIRRGIKPSVFEIYKNDVLIEQTNKNDYQNTLESKILKTTFRTFTQTCFISIENYKPFMSLTKWERREFVEDILDIRVFSVMNVLLKSKISKSKERLKIVEIELKNAKQKVLLLKNHLEELQNNRNNLVKQYDENEESISNQINSLNIQIEELNKKESIIISEIEKLKIEKKSYDKIEKMSDGLNHSINSIEKNEKFFHDSAACPTCRQNITEEHKSNILSKTTDEKNSLKESLEDLRKNMSNLSTSLELLSTKQNELNKIQISKSTILNSIQMNSSSLRKLIKDREVLNSNYESIETKKLELKNTASDALLKQKEKADIATSLIFDDAKYELLKDSGIKSKIIKQYIPVINKLLNEYLEKFEFFVSFNLDEEFNETIKSRHRDDFTYDNFSMGEKQRIDLASLFTMRRIARMKNSFDCNLLFFDEVGDASIDGNGTDCFLDILDSHEFSKTNIFVISHRNKDKFADRFENVLEFSKEGNFTVVNSVN